MGKRDSFWFSKKILIMAKMREAVHFLGQNQHVNFSLSLFIRFFWKCTWWPALKRSWNDYFGFLRKIFYHAQNRVNALFLDQKSLFLTSSPNLWNRTRWQALKNGFKWLFWIFKFFFWFFLSLNLFIRYFRIRISWQGVKIEQKSLFWIMKENSYYAQKGLNGRSVRTRGPLRLYTCFNRRQYLSSIKYSICQVGNGFDLITQH